MKESNLQELGRKLKEARTACDLSYEEIHQKTRIRLHVLESIESGQAGHLPAQTFRGFVRTIAREVGLDGDALLADYDVRQDSHRQGTRIPTEDVHPSRSAVQKLKQHRRTILMSLTGVVIASVTAVYLFYGARLFRDPSTLHAPDSTRDDPSITPIQSDTSETVFFILQAAGLKDSWFEVRVDSSEGETVYLERGQKRTWRATESVAVRLEDLRSVRLARNETPLEWPITDTTAGVDLWIGAEGSIRYNLLQPVKNVEPVSQEIESSVVLTGFIDESDLISQIPLYGHRRDQYQPNSIIISQIERIDPKLSILCFLGSWDELSQEVLPPLLRILKVGYLPGVRLSLIGVGQELEDTTGLARLHTIQGIPTVVFLFQGQELGRLVGRPDERIEARFLAIAERAGLIQGHADDSPNDTLR